MREPLKPLASHGPDCQKIMRMATEVESCDEDTDILDGDRLEEHDPNIVEERFRVDRRKLEQMLQAAEEGMGETGEEFFQKIMKETTTKITWPSKLKIGAKSKKDPHIKVAGLPESVRMAKEKVMAVLDTKSNRVTLKMDVSHTDHSHIIGKGGYNIKKVMQDTGCHIHFPDSNRGSSNEKSNQVSIAGQPLGVESARQHIRDMLPLVLTFELPLGGRSPTDSNSPVIQNISQACNVAITFKQRPRSGSQTAIVRGCQQHVSEIKEAIVRLVEHFTGNIASSVPVNMQIDIAPQHHLFIIGRNGSNIKHIMQQTGASVNFPDPNGTQRKGVVFLTGTVESVICARSQLLDCLPLVLMFDLREEDGDIDPMKLNKIMEKYDVFVSVKPKPKQPSKSVIIKSAERNAKNVYFARMEVLGVDKNENRASSPIYSASILPPCSFPLTRPHYSILEINSPPSVPPYSSGQVNGQMSPPTPTTSNSWFQTSVSSSLQTGNPMMDGVMSSFSYMTTSPLPHPPPGLGPPNSCIGGPGVSVVTPSFNGDYSTSPTGSYGSIDSSSTSSVLSGNSTTPTGKPPSPIGQRTCSPMEHYAPSPIGPRHARSPIMDQRESPILHGSSGSSSPTSTIQDEAYLTNLQSDSDMDTIHSLLHGSSSTVGAGYERQTVEILSGAKNVSLYTSDAGDSDSLSSSLRSALLNKVLLNRPSTPPTCEYERKKELASKAMQKKVQFPEVRVPTDTWSGLGFSKSMPEAAIRELLEMRARNKGGMLPYSAPLNGTLPEVPFSPSSMSSYDGGRESRSNSTSVYESTSRHLERPVTFSPTVGEWRNTFSLAPSHPSSDLEDLFDRLGLIKYFDKFQEQEVDLQTFMTLTDEDLKELGVSTFGARRKILMAIADLNKNQKDTGPPPSRHGASRNVEPLPFQRRLPLDIASHSGRW